MITEGPPVAGFHKAAPLALAAWFGGLALLTPLAEPTRDVLVFGPTTTIATLPSAGASLVDVAAGWARVRREEPGFVARLYASGAWLVLPAFEGGCNRAASPEARLRKRDP
jgi:hypothetical protein